MNPHCRPKQAKAAIDKVFDQCFEDTAPFDRWAPYRDVCGRNKCAQSSALPPDACALCWSLVCRRKLWRFIACAQDTVMWAGLGFRVSFVSSSCDSGVAEKF